MYIPVEIYKREMPAKLILALKATRQGYSVIIGRHYLVEKIALEGGAGVYLGTTVVEAKNEFYTKLKAKGSVIIAQDEEGLVYYNKMNFLQHRVIPSVLKNVDIFLTWGEHHRDIIREKYFGNNVSILGNIRFEMLKEKYYSFYKTEEQTIRQKYGKFVLVNTNLAAYNHILSPHANIANIAKQGTFNDADNKFYCDKVAHQKKVMEAIIAFVKSLSTVLPQDYTIIVRPHPAEKTSGWEVVSSERIKVIQEGSVIPWIYAAECVVQQNCTTAIEATLLNKKVFSFIPCYDERFDGSFINQISEVQISETELVKSVKNFIDKNTVNDNYEYINILDKYINNICETDDSILQLLDVIDKKAIETDQKIRTYPQIILSIVKLLFLYKTSKKNSIYKNAKFLKFCKSDIRKCIEKLSQIDQLDYGKIKIKTVCDDVFLLEKKC